MKGVIKMRIAIASDHGGFELKEIIKDYLIQKKYDVKDFGVENEDSVDYPDIAHVACEAIISGQCEKGILICGTGVGISIAANKLKGIRAALCSDCFSARMAAEHNNANVIALGGRVVGSELAKEIVKTYLTAKFQKGRHQVRVDKVHKLEIL